MHDMTCEIIFCFWSDTKSQLAAVCSFSYTELAICFCVANKSE